MKNSIKILILLISVLSSYSAFSQLVPRKTAPFYLTVSELKAWTTTGSTASSANVSTEVIAPRQYDMNSQLNPNKSFDMKVDWCPDGMDIWSNFITEQSQFNLFNFTHWQYIDKLTWFCNAGNGVFIPSKPWIDAAHKNGVKIVGTIFFYGDETQVSSFLEKSGDTFIVAQKLIDIANYYGFDGWFINEEESVYPSTGADMIELLKQLQTIKSANMEISWYDSMLPSGWVNYQNGLSDSNKALLQDGTERVSDEMFTNYWWGESQVATSVSTANSINRSPFDVYTGCDVWPGRYAEQNLFTKNHTFMNTLYTNSDLAQPRTSVAIFAANLTWNAGFHNFWTDETDYENFYKTEVRLFSGDDYNLMTEDVNSWKGFGYYWPVRTVITSLPFETSFNVGQGKIFATNGNQVTRNWTDISKQTILPSWQWAKTGASTITVGYDFNNAYNGGTSIEIAGSLNSNDAIVKLHQTKLAVSSNTKFDLTYKAGSSGDTNLKLLLYFSDNLSTPVEMNLGNAANTNWNTFTFDLSSFAGKELSIIGMKVVSSGSVNNYAMNLGEIKIYDSSSGCISTFPYTESFENNDIGGWIQSTTDDFNWDVNSGSTPSTATGPTSANDGTYYIYTESSSPNYSSKTAILTSPCFDMTSLSGAAFTFDYHMYGASMGILKLEASTDGAIWTEIWSKSGDQGNSWFSESVDLSSYVGQASVLFRLNAVTGTSYTSDFAIDKIEIKESGGTTPPQDPKLLTGVLTNVSDSWQTVTLTESYNSMVVVCTPNYSSSDVPAIVRIRNASGNSFEAKVQNPGDGTALNGYTVHYMVVEEGIYTQALDGVKMEAVKFTSTITDENDSWVGQSRAYSNSYTNPVVLGQVMTANDAGWSTFWSQGDLRTEAPTSSIFYAGKNVAEDTDITRVDEELGYIVIEAGTGTIDGLAYTTALGANSVLGMDDNPPFNYSISGLSSVGTAIVTQSGMDGTNGGWGALYGSSPVSTSNLSSVVDEDQIMDSERAHIAEQMAYIIFEGTGLAPGQATVPNPADGATDISLTAALSWTAGTGTDSHDMYFGTTNPPAFVGNQTGTTYDPGTMVENTTYYWRVDEKNTVGTTTGTVWSFTTQQSSGCISAFPYTESFENNDIGGWIQSTTDDFNWDVNSGSTPSTATGPTSANDGTYYIYIESSSPNYSSKTAILTSPCFDMTSLSGAAFTFDYHMYGASMGILKLEASTDGATWAEIWSKSGDQGNSWFSESVDLSSYVGQSSVLFRLNAVTSTFYTSDISIDKIEITTLGTKSAKISILSQQHVEEIKIFPNPTDGLVNLRFSNLEVPLKMKVIDLSGKVIKQRDILPHTNIETINLINQPTGVYFIRLSDINGIVHKSQKVILK